MVEEHRSKIPDLLNQMYNEMDEYVKESRREVSLKETHHLTHVLFKIVQCSFINDLLRDCIKGAEAHDRHSDFFWQYVPDTNFKHRCEHDITIMSLHGKHLVFSCRHKLLDVGYVSRGKFDTTKEVAQFLIVFLGQVYGR